MSFEDLMLRFNFLIPTKFRYLQLRHASQFGSVRVQIKPSSLENILLDESLKKTLSELYKELFPVPPPLVVKCREQWVEEVLDLGGEDWDGDVIAFQVNVVLR